MDPSGKQFLSLESPIARMRLNKSPSQVNLRPRNADRTPNQGLLLHHKRNKALISILSPNNLKSPKTHKVKSQE